MSTLNSVTILDICKIGQNFGILIEVSTTLGNRPLSLSLEKSSAGNIKIRCEEIYECTGC